MKLSAFVDDSQLGDRGRISVGEQVVVHLVGIPIEETLLVLPSAARGIAATGILEYQFRGVIRQVRMERVREYLHHQALLDCRVPLVLSRWASEPLSVGDSIGRLWSALGETHIGKNLSGLALVRADISYAHPDVIQAGVRARVNALKRVNLSGAPEEKLDQFEYRRDKTVGMIGLLMTVEILEPMNSLEGIET